MLQIVNRRLEVACGEIRSVLLRFPDLVDGLCEVLAQLRASGDRIGSVVGQGAVELKEFGASVCTATPWLE